MWWLVSESEVEIVGFARGKVALATVWLAKSAVARISGGSRQECFAPMKVNFRSGLKEALLLSFFRVVN